MDWGKYLLPGYLDAWGMSEFTSGADGLLILPVLENSQPCPPKTTLRMDKPSIRGMHSKGPKHHVNRSVLQSMALYTVYIHMYMYIYIYIYTYVCNYICQCCHSAVDHKPLCLRGLWSFKRHGITRCPFHTTAPIPKRRLRPALIQPCLDLLLGWGWYRMGYFTKPSLCQSQTPSKEPSIPSRGMEGGTLEVHQSKGSLIKEYHPQTK